jgi:transposase
MQSTTIYIGMDMHKRTSTFAVKDRDGTVLAKEKVETDPAAITTFLQKFPKATLAVEPVSQWYFYADLMQSLGIDVHLANPLKVKAIASARIKTDSIDAGVLCDLLRANLLPEAYFASPDVRRWKEMCRYRVSLMNLRTEIKNKIHAILFKNGLQHPFTDLFGKGGRQWLASLTLAEQYAYELRHYLTLLDALTALITEADKKIEQTVTDHPQAKLLTTIPAVKYVSALTIMAEIGDISRFPSAKKLMGYAGLVPSTYSSGDMIRHGRITKQGSKWLRTTMIEIAQRQLLCKKNPGLGWYYLKVKKRKGSSAAAVATARKLCAVVWRMLTDNRSFEVRLPQQEGQDTHRRAIVTRSG